MRVTAPYGYEESGPAGRNVKLFEHGGPPSKPILSTTDMNQYREGKVKSTPRGVKETETDATISGAPSRGDGVPCI